MMAINYAQMSLYNEFFVYLHTSEALFMGEYLEFIVYLHENTCCD